MTFSVLVSLPARHLLGAGCASRSLAVGHSVPAVVPGVGVVVSQAWTNRSLRGRGLAALRRGETPAAYVASLPALDSEHAWRQVAVVAADGTPADHTGADCSAWAGARQAGIGAATVLAVGNLLPGPEVLDAAVAAAVDRLARDTTPSALGLAECLVAGLVAGQERGGDLRGEQSAAVMVGSGPVQGYVPPDLDVDLRVDDARQPLAELARLLQVRTRSGGLPVTPRTE